MKDLFMKFRRSNWEITVTLSRQNDVGQILQIGEVNEAVASRGGFEKSILIWFRSPGRDPAKVNLEFR